MEGIAHASKVRVGCCGWALGRARYFESFTTVEVQTTFYAPPAVALAEKWKQEAPPDFRFCIKAWQLITHPVSSPTYRRLKTPLPEGSRGAVGGFQDTDEVRRAWETTLAIADALDAAVIVFQCPASFRPTEPNLRNLDAFFRRVGPCRSLLAWEPRGDWPDDVVSDLCARRNLIHCVDPFLRDPVTPGVRYFRLHGRGGYRYRYTDPELDELHARLGPDPGWVQFNNVWMKDDALRMVARLRRAVE